MTEAGKILAKPPLQEIMSLPTPIPSIGQGGPGINTIPAAYMNPYHPICRELKDTMAVSFCSGDPAEGPVIEKPPAGGTGVDRVGTAARTRISVDSVPPNTRRGGDIRVTLSPKTVGCTSGFGGLVRLAPGEYVTEHLHPYSEEFLHVVRGSLEMALDGEPVALSRGDSLLVPVGVRHRLVNVGEAQAEVVFHLSPLAPRPELGHVDTEQPAHPAAVGPVTGEPVTGRSR